MKKTLSLLMVFVCATASAEVVRFDVESRSDVADGMTFGLAGAYEKISGRVHLAFDPELDENSIIRDIEHAPVNADGHVQMSTEFVVLKPKDIARGNRALLLEVGNRGRKGLLGFFNFGESSLDPDKPEHFGDGFLMREGFTLIWVGWQWDTPEQPGLMRMYPPIASDNGAPIRGLVRSDFVPLEHETDHSLADRNHIPYVVADADAAENVLTVRDDVESERTVIPRSRWRFARVEDGKVVPDNGRVYLEGGFEPFKIYEVVYVSENPPIVGLGPAAIRDVVSGLKYDGASELGIAPTAIDRAHGFGISQSGRFLRTFLYHGFNQDESQRKVFDGVLAHVAGGGRGSFNHRFAQASRDAHPYINFFYPTDIFPFTDRAQVDFRTGVNDGVLVFQKPEHLPKVFYTNSSYEYWGRAASLIHTSIDAREDVKLMDNVRIYHFAGTQHGPAPFPPTVTSGQQESNPMDPRWSMRALLVALDRWTAESVAPPPSQYGRIESKTLVAPEELDFPHLPGVETEARIHKAYRADYGPEFRTDGIVTEEPPKIGPAFPMMVPAVDEDGNEVAGISLPEHAVALATYTGWNVSNPSSGPTHVLANMQGSFIPFARDSKERAESGDPRRSILERYRGRDEYLGLVTEAALELIDDGYLLEHDLAEIVRRAASHWDYIMSPSRSPR